MEGPDTTLRPVQRLVPYSQLSTASAPCHSDKGLCHRTVTAMLLQGVVSVFLSILEGLLRDGIPGSHLIAPFAGGLAYAPLMAIGSQVRG